MESLSSMQSPEARRSYEVTEILEKFSPEEIAFIDSYQLATAENGDFFRGRPVPESDDPNWRAKMAVVCNNTNKYEDDPDLKQFIESDPIMQTLERDWRRMVPHVIYAYRARKAVLVYKYSTGNTPELSVA